MRRRVTEVVAARRGVVAATQHRSGNDTFALKNERRIPGVTEILQGKATHEDDLAKGTPIAACMAAMSHPPLHELTGVVIEIRRSSDGGPPLGTLRAAYELAHHVPVVLALDACSRQEVDRLLDRMVTRTDFGIPGVRYADVDDPEGVRAMAPNFRHAFVDESRLRQVLCAQGIACHHLNELAESFH